MRKKLNRFIKRSRKDFVTFILDALLLTVWLMNQWVIDEIKLKYKSGGVNIFAFDTLQIIVVITFVLFGLARSVYLVVKLYYSMATKFIKLRNKYHHEKQKR